MRHPIFLVIFLFIGSSAIANETTLSPQMSDELRAMVLNLEPKDIGLNKETFAYSVYGIVMETGVSEGAYTLSSIADGSTSLYFSNGGGIIGGGEHKSVREASMYFLSGAEHFQSKAKAVTLFPKPKEGHVVFYFLTVDGVKSYNALEVNLGKEKDDLSGLFFAAHSVISELRNTENK